MPERLRPGFGWYAHPELERLPRRGASHLPSMIKVALKGSRSGVQILTEITEQATALKKKLAKEISDESTLHC